MAMGNSSISILLQWRHTGEDDSRRPASGQAH
jgi:hypothetical protein